VVTAASYAGTALAFGLSPLLITRLGWPWIFYLFGGAALLWLPFWLPLNVYSKLQDGSSSSSSSKQAADSSREQQPLLLAGGSTTGSTAAGGTPGSSSSSTGFRALLRRREVWAICVCQYSQSYGMYGLLTWLPTFFSEFYEVQVGDLGGYTLLPYFVQVSSCSAPGGGGACTRWVGGWEGGLHRMVAYAVFRLKLHVVRGRK
jgi:ACS family sodium-dependent inorganic phosphate cotransporter